MYPIGAIYISVDPTNPESLLGGTWERFAQGRTLIGSMSTGDADYDNNFDGSLKTGGSRTHTLTVAEMPSHTHTVRIGNVDDKNFSGNAGQVPPADGTGIVHQAANNVVNAEGGNQPHNNLQPYITVYMFRRVA